MTQLRFKAVIADDEPLARRFLVRCLAEDPEIEVVAECANGLEVVAALEPQDIDILLLDIEMPGLTGLEALERLGARPAGAIVFTTAHRRFAVEAFDHQAVDFLLKPFDVARCATALARAKQQARGGRAPHDLAQIVQMLQGALRGPATRARLSFKLGDRTIVVNQDDIDWIEADDKYVRLHVAAETYAVRQTLAHMESVLDGNSFVRAHRSAIVNVERVREISPLYNGEHRILLSSGATLTLGRSYRDRFFAVLGRPI